MPLQLGTWLRRVLFPFVGVVLLGCSPRLYISSAVTYEDATVYSTTLRGAHLFKLKRTYLNGSTEDASDQVIWTSSNAAVAQARASDNRIVAKGVGTAELTGELEGNTFRAND